MWCQKEANCSFLRWSPMAHSSPGFTVMSTKYYKTGAKRPTDGPINPGAAWHTNHSFILQFPAAGSKSILISSTPYPWRCHDNVRHKENVLRNHRMRYQFYELCSVHVVAKILDIAVLHFGNNFSSHNPVFLFWSEVDLFKLVMNYK